MSAAATSFLTMRRANARSVPTRNIRAGAVPRRTHKNKQTAAGMPFRRSTVSEHVSGWLTRRAALPMRYNRLHVGPSHRSARARAFRLQRHQRLERPQGWRGDGRGHATRRGGGVGAQLHPGRVGVPVHRGLLQRRVSGGRHLRQLQAGGLDLRRGLRVLRRAWSGVLQRRVLGVPASAGELQARQRLLLRSVRLGSVSRVRRTGRRLRSGHALLLGLGVQRWRVHHVALREMHDGELPDRARSLR